MLKYIHLSETGELLQNAGSSDPDEGPDVRSSLNRIMLGQFVDQALDLMEKDGVLARLIPGLDGVVNLKDPKNRFKDLWDHTKKVVKQSHPKLEIRWAALFHDFGKPSTFRMENGKVSFHNHESVSVKYFIQFTKKCPIFGRQELNKIKFLIYHLGYVESYSSTWTDSAVRRFAKEMGTHLDDIMLLSSADITSSKEENYHKIYARLAELKSRIEKIVEEDNKVPPLPKGIGNAIIESLGVNPGKDVGKVKTKLEDDIKNGLILAHQEIDYYISYLNESN